MMMMIINTLLIHFLNRWLDGCFQDLDGESMEVKVDEFYREMFKMLKFFQQKQSKADPRIQKNPTILLCSAVLEELKEFKVLYGALV